MRKQWMLLSLVFALFATYSNAQTSEPMQEQGGSGMGAPTNPGPMSPNGTQNPSYPGTSTGTAPSSKMPAPAKVSDSDLQSAVRSMLGSDPAFANVQATVEKGNVTLDGAVNSKEDKKRVKDEVKAIAGVRKVKEHLTVSAADNQARPSASGSGPGMAMLNDQDSPQSGTTANQNTAGSTAGNSQTSANPSSQSEPATAPEAGTMGSGQTGATPERHDGSVPQSDTAAPTGAADTLTLQRQIQSAIKSDPSLTQSSVSVNVTDTAIDLEGTVANDGAKTTAERIAQSYAINRKVVNNLQVTGRGNSDLSPGQSSMSNGSAGTTPSSTGTGKSDTGTGSTTDQSTAPQPESAPK